MRSAGGGGRPAPGMKIEAAMVLGLYFSFVLRLLIPLLNKRPKATHLLFLIFAIGDVGCTTEHRLIEFDIANRHRVNHHAFSRTSRFTTLLNGLPETSASTCAAQRSNAVVFSAE